MVFGISIYAVGCLPYDEVPTTSTLNVTKSPDWYVAEGPYRHEDI